MKRIAPFFIALLTMLFITACGSPASRSTRVPAATQPPAQPAATTSPSQTTEAPSATEASTQSGATEVPVTGGGTQVDIKLADNTIESSTTTFQVGVPYKFVISNTGRHPHNFNINPPVSIAGSLEEALNKALLAVPQEQLSPGQSVTVAFTFPDSAAGQMLEFSCLIRRHYDDGMHVDITVTK